MGAILRRINPQSTEKGVCVYDSSNKDYNRVLARQPRKSLGLLKLEPSKDLQQHPLTGTLSIPDPVRISRSTNPVPTEPPVVNQQSEIIQIQTEPIPQRIPSPTIENHIQQQQPEEELIVQSSPYFEQSTIPMYNPTMNRDAIIISRSVLNLNNHQRSNRNHVAPLRRNSTIVERNGKQFLTELKERMERRYVQVFDENTGRMRLFEVTDYIPSRTVRSMRHNSQYPLKNVTPQNNFQSQQRLALPPIPNGRTGSAPPSNFRGLNNQETLNREFNLYHSGANLPLNNNNVPSAIPPQPQPRMYNPAQPHFQSNVYNSSSIVSQGVPNQLPSGSYRPHSPTGSDYSEITSNATTINSGNESDNEGDDSESINRNKAAISDGTGAGYNSPTQIDPFAKPVNRSNHHYAHRSNVNNYSEPIPKNRGFPTSGNLDYAPIPQILKQTNRNRYSVRKSSNSSAYDG